MKIAEKNLYITADAVGRPDHGAGSVTWNESEALRSLGSCEVWDRKKLCDPPFYFSTEDAEEPWRYDNWCNHNFDVLGFGSVRLAHFYAGTFSKTIAKLKPRGVKISYTAAAHSIKESRREHEALGIPYQYDHITDPAKWARYVEGYLAADLLFVPSEHSAGVMRSFGADPRRVRVVPHGCEVPEAVAQLPSSFTVGYLGNCTAPDKGLRYLLEAWSKADIRDGTLKVAGHDSAAAIHLWHRFGGRGNVQFCGWQNDSGRFYDSLSCYVQPSVTEGFGIGVLEAQAHGRTTFCSTGAGAADCVSERFRFAPRDVDALRVLILQAREWHEQVGFEGCGTNLAAIGRVRRAAVKSYSWAKIRERYSVAWKELLG